MIVELGSTSEESSSEEESESEDETDETDEMDEADETDNDTDEEAENLDTYRAMCLQLDQFDVKLSQGVYPNQTSKKPVMVKKIIDAAALHLE